MADDTKGGDESLDLSSLGSFDFTPAWAKGRPDDKARFARFESPRDDADARRSGNDVRKPHGGGRKPEFDGRGPRRDDRGPRRDDRGPRRDDRGGDRRGERAPRPFVKPLDVDVRILPSQKELGPLIRQLQTKHTAYALKQLAYLFLDNPSACMLRLSPRKDAAEEILFHQCKVCGFTVLSGEELVAHLLAEHLPDYYSSEEIECEPPKGTFTCVAKCGVTGEFLGPPNLHGYDARIREMLRTRCAGMSEADYRARIEMVRDPETIEQWRASATKKTVYKRKGEENDEHILAREAAEADFRRTVLPGLVSTATTVDLSADVALKSSCRPLVFACRDAISKERHYPASLLFALRGAFHHRKLKFFRANDPRGPEFVVAQDFSALDVEHAIPELAALVRFVEEHPCVTQAQTVAALAQGDEARMAEIKKTLSWLIEKGHLVGYFNGVLAIPAAHPKYHPPAQRKITIKPDAAAPAEKPAAPAEEPAPVTVEEPAPEPVEEPAPAPVPAEEPAPAPAEEPPAEQ
ncbi:MAG: hypothetical protein IKO72_05105 [Kiritimatiellae bacterium]|nr:hypothetical protein [Kiritimatiellia bacterium]